MIAINLLFIAILLISCSIEKSLLKTKEVFDKNYWLGTWDCIGYTCGGRGPPEEITITYKDKLFTAVKNKGDGCVRRGKRTFWGKIQDEVDTTKRVPVTFQTGAPGNPESGTNVSTCVIHDKNSFTCWSVKCTRNSAYEELNLPAPLPISAPPTQYIQQPTQYIQQPTQYIQQPTQYIQQPQVIQLPPQYMQQPSQYVMGTPLFIWSPPSIVQNFQPINYFPGTWNVGGFVCNGVVSSLSIKFSLNGTGGFSAVVVAANSCLNAGATYLSGTIPTVMTNLTPVMVSVLNNNSFVPTNLFVLGSNVFIIPKFNLNFTKSC